MINIPYIKIPQISIGGIPSTLNVYPAQEGSGNVSPNPPTPITYLTQWKIVGNSEVHGNEIWSCGEYNPIDGKYHILVQPQGGNIADIALDEPLRKVNDIADTIEFPSETEGKALVTRNFGKYDIGLVDWEKANQPVFRMQYISDIIKSRTSNIICAKYTALPGQTILANSVDKSVFVYDSMLRIRDEDYINVSVADFQQDNLGVLILFELATPTTELVNVPQIAEAESYSMVISQGAKAVEWSGFTTEVIP